MAEKPAPLDVGVPFPWPVHGQGHSVGKVLVDDLVAGHAGGVDVFQLEDDPARLALGQPIVKTKQGGPQPPLQQHLPAHRSVPSLAHRGARRSTLAAPATAGQDPRHG